MAYLSLYIDVNDIFLDHDKDLTIGKIWHAGILLYGFFCGNAWA